MTPATQKAQEIYNQLWDKFPAQSAIHFDLNPFVKDCASIAVDLVIEEYKKLEKQFNGDFKQLDWWKEVKKEIESL